MQKIKKYYSKASSIIDKVYSYIQEKPYLQTILVFTFLFLIFLWMYFSVTLLSSGDDHYFHFRFTEIIRDHGFKEAFTNFKAVYFSPSAHNEYFLQYNFLFNLAVIPFTYIQPLYLGIKLFSVVIISLNFTILFICLKAFKVRVPIVWTLAAIAVIGTGSLWRFLLSRPYTFAPALLLLLLYFLYKKNKIGIFIISFLYLYWHCVTFFFPLFIAATYYIFEQFYFKKGDWKSLLASFLGVLSALILVLLLTPGFLRFINIEIFGIIWDSILSKKVFIPEGGEVYPIKIFNYMSSNLILFCGLVIGVIVDIGIYISHRFKNEQLGKFDSLLVLRSTILFICIGFLAGIIIISARFSDYFVFFSSLYLILLIDVLIPYFKISNQILRKSFLIGLCVLGTYLFTSNILSVQQLIANQGSAPEQFEGLGNWLNNNTEKGDIIFNMDWSWFSQLYYYSPNNYYVTGIEPRSFYIYDKRLYWIWLNMENGYLCEQASCPNLTEQKNLALRTNTTRIAWYKTQGDQIANTLLNDFHSHYLMSSFQYPDLNAVLDNNAHFKKVYGGDRAYYIYEVLP